MGSKTSKTSDRRIQRTHRALREALIALVSERGWDDFSVRDLCERADIARSTFYLHFADKDDVLTGGIEDFRRAVREQVASQKGGGQPLAFARAVIDHVWEQQRAFRALLGKRSGQAVMRRFREFVVDLVQDDLSGMAAPKREKGAAARFLAGGFLELLTWGLEPGSASGPQELEQLFRRLAAPALALLRRG